MTVASPGTRRPPAVTAIRFSGVPAWRAMCGLHPAVNPQLAGRNGVTAPGKAAAHAPSEPSRGQDAPPSASTTGPVATAAAGSNRGAPAASHPSQRCRMRNCTPSPSSRRSQARSSGDAFMARGNTRPLLPVNTGWPSASHHAHSAAGGNAATAGARNARAGPYRSSKPSSGSPWVRFRPPTPAISSLRAGEGMRSNTVTATPPSARRSAAINPAGPAPMTVAARGVLADAGGMIERVEAVVLGAGVVGLAVARALALAGREVLLLEAAGGIGTVTSSRNSEVVHAGIYYPTGSLKARLCVAGRQALYGYCDAHGVPVHKLGKLIVASDPAETQRLAGIAAQAAANGVALAHLPGEAARAMEPALRVDSALHSPETGIIDSHALMLAYQGDMEAAGGVLAVHAPLAGGAVTGSGIRLDVGGEVPMQLECRLLVNAAGLHAPDVARRIAGIPSQTIPRA